MPQTLIVAALRDETDRIRVFDLTAPDGGPVPAWTAGAHLTFDLGAVGTRSYSLIKWPGNVDPGHYVIAVQREDDGDGGSQKMHELSVGDKVTADGPKNDFEVRAHDGPAVLLAGGIGITPMISMATTLRAQNRPFRLIYTARSPDVMAFGPALTDAFGASVSLHHDDTNPLDLATLAGSLTPDAHLYICGPKGMIDAARTAATQAGHPDDQIHIELFTTAATADGDTAFEVELSSTGDVFTIPPGQTIIDVLEDAGVDLIYDCQRGDCGICQTDVISGVPDHRDVVLSDAEKDSGKLMQICVSRAKSDRLVLDL